MKVKLLLLLVFSVGSVFSQQYKEMISSGEHTVYEIQQAAKNYFQEVGEGKGTGFVQYKRWEYFALKSMDENGKLKGEQHNYDELERYNAERNASTKSESASFLNDNWIEMGPNYWNETSGWNSGVGRLTSIAVNELNQNHLVVGSKGGGIWKTLNKGGTWESLTDNHGNMYVTSLAMDQSNTNVIYWGSINGRTYKTINGGETWSPIGIAGNSDVLKIIVSPVDSNVLFAAVEYNGVYKSVNGGASWSHISSAGTRGYDVEFDPNNSSILFASGNYVYRSSNGGSSFSYVSGFGNGPKMIGVTKSDSNRVYVVEANNGSFSGLYRSDNNGMSFTKLNHTGYNYFGYETDASDTRGQAPRDMAIAVSPTNPNELHIAGIITWRSINGGVSFSCTSNWSSAFGNANLGYCHADVDDLMFIGSTLYSVTDGGVYICENTSVINSQYYTDITSGMGIRQFYLLGISQTNSVVISAGAQDNGTSAYRSNGQWVDWLGADGFESIVDVNNSNILYGTIYYGDLFKSYDQGLTYNSIAKPDDGNWETPLEQDGNGNLYFGGSSVYKSTNGGNSWSLISSNFGTPLDELKVAPSNNNIIYASIGSYLYRRYNSGTWYTVPNYNGGSINSIAINPLDPNKVVVAAADSNKIYRTLDGGNSWSVFNNGLPDFSAYTLAWDNNGKDGIYLGMDYGVYYIDNDYATWQLFNNNLPNVKVTELEVNYADNNVYASTYGRGIWKSQRYSEMLNVEENALNEFQMFPNPVKDIVTIEWDKQVKVSIRVFNVVGELVKYKRDVNLHNGYRLDLSGISSGAYSVRINSSNGVLTKKLIVNN